MRSRSKLVSISVAVVASAMLLAGCVPGAGSATSSGESGKATVTLDNPTSFDPRRSIALPDYLLARAAYDTLLRKDDSGLVPGLATSWESTPNSVTLSIRDDATCSDGTPITPSIVRASLESYATTGNPASVAQTFGGSVPTITADDEAGTVTVQVEMPWQEMLAGFTVANTGIICPAGLEAGEKIGTEPIKGAGSGPYTLTSFEPGVSYTFTLRDDYTAWPEWTTELAGEAPKTLEYVVASDPSSTANLTLAGDYDIARIMPDSRSRFDGNDDVTLTGFPFGTFYLMFNEREGNPFADRSKRVAVAQAIDRAAADQTITDGTGQLLNTLVSDATPCATGKPSSTLIEYDPEAAAGPLAGVNVRLLGAQVVGNAGAGNVYIEEALRAAGANVTLENVDIGTWASRAFGEPNTWDLTIYPDLNFLGSLASPIGKFIGPDVLDGGGNVGGTVAPTASDLFAQARSTSDETERCALYNAAADSLFADAHTVPLTNESYIYAQRDGYKVYMLGGSLDDHIFRITG